MDPRWKIALFEALGESLLPVESLKFHESFSFSPNERLHRAEAFWVSPIYQ